MKITDRCTSLQCQLLPVSTPPHPLQEEAHQSTQTHDSDPSNDRKSKQPKWVSNIGGGWAQSERGMVKSSDIWRRCYSSRLRGVRCDSDIWSGCLLDAFGVFEHVHLERGSRTDLGHAEEIKSYRCGICWRSWWTGTGLSGPVCWGWCPCSLNKWLEEDKHGSSDRATHHESESFVTRSFISW